MATKVGPVPFTGRYNTRIQQTNAAAGAGGIWGVGVWGTFIWGAGATASDKDERYINCFLTDQGGRKYVIKRPGMGVNNTPSVGNTGSAILVWSGQGAGTKVITAFGATNSTIYDGTNSLGAITGEATGITETTITTTATLAISSSDNTGWVYDTGGGLVQISDGDFPGNAGKALAGTFAHMDGFAFIMDTTGALWNSDLNSLTAWTATGFISANAYPDQGIGCLRYRNMIAAFGTQSIQFFINAGNATGSPLQRIDNATIKVGAINANAIAQISDAIFFVGSGPEGGCTVYMYDGGLQRISFPEQDFRLILAGPTNIRVTTLKYYGRSFVLVVAGSSTFVYCIEDQRWHEWSGTTPLWDKCAGLSVGSQIITYSISTRSTSGKVYTINPASLVFTDDGAAYTATLQSAVDDAGTQNLKFADELRIVCDQEPSTSSLVISVSDDDYGSFVTVGTVDISQAFPRLTRLGAYRRRVWRGTHSSNTAFRIEALERRVRMGYA